MVGHHSPGKQAIKMTTSKTSVGLPGMHGSKRNLLARGAWVMSLKFWGVRHRALV